MDNLELQSNQTQNSASEVQDLEHNDTNNSSGFFGKPNVKLVLKTIKWFGIAFTLFAVLFTLIFPHTTMRMYHSLNLPRATAHHASRVVNRNQGRDGYNRYDSRFSDGLFMAASLNGQFLSDQINNGDFDSRRSTTIAERTLRYTNMILGDYAGLSSERMQTVIDPIRLNTYISRSDRIHLFRYETQVRQDRIRAQYILGYANNLAVELTGRLQALNNLLNSAPLLSRPNPYFYIDAYVAFLLVELNALLSVELSFVGYDYIRQNYYNEAGHAIYGRDAALASLNVIGRFNTLIAGGPNPNTVALNHLSTLLPRIREYIMAIPANTEYEMLRRTWWLFNLTSLSSNIRLITHTFYLSTRVPALFDIWDNWANDIDIIYVSDPTLLGVRPPQEFSTAAWFNQLILPNYVAFRP